MARSSTPDRLTAITIVHRYLEEKHQNVRAAISGPELGLIAEIVFAIRKARARARRRLPRRT